MSAIGIDLGTTYSSVAVVRDGKVDVIANDQGRRTTPSCVSFSDDGLLVGDEAQYEMVRNPKNTVFGVKRIIGRMYSDDIVQEEMKRWEFSVINCNKKAKIQVTDQGTRKSLHPEEVSAHVLKRMKKIAEDYVGKDVFSAVITVPAHFNNSQRRATKGAAEIAGFHVLGMIHEPTAAAIAYGMQHESEKARNILVFDLGGGTFDVTVMTLEDGIFDVKATKGDPKLGGEDFTKILFDHLVDEFKRTEKKDIRSSPRAKYRLMKECEAVKRSLSAQNVLSTRVFIDALYEGKDFDVRVSRATFEDLNLDLFNRSLDLVKQVLKDAQLNKVEIDDVVLVGGSTRIPYVQEMLANYFGEDKIRKTINADEAIANGAAAHAAFLSGDLSREMKKLDFRDVTPISLGTELKNGDMSVIIARNTTIPTTKTHQYKTMRDYQTAVSILIYEGEHAKCSDNFYLGTLRLSDFPSLPSGEAKIVVEFNIDSSGVLHVSAREKSTGLSSKCSIETAGGRMSESEIKKLIQAAGGN